MLHHELRRLADDLTQVCADSDCSSVAMPIVALAADHLRSMARNCEMNQREVINESLQRLHRDE